MMVRTWLPADLGLTHSVQNLVSTHSASGDVWTQHPHSTNVIRESISKWQMSDEIGQRLNKLGNVWRTWTTTHTPRLCVMQVIHACSHCKSWYFLTFVQAFVSCKLSMLSLQIEIFRDIWDCLSRKKYRMTLDDTVPVQCLLYPEFEKWGAYG